MSNLRSKINYDLQTRDFDVSYGKFYTKFGSFLNTKANNVTAICWSRFEFNNYWFSKFEVSSFEKTTNINSNKLFKYVMKPVNTIHCLFAL